MTASDGASYFEVIRALLTEHGVSVFLRGWTPFFLRSSPVIITGMPLYEQVRRLLGLGYMS